MAGFMAGFGSAFSQSFENERERNARKEEDLFKNRFTMAREQAEAYRKQKEKDTQYVGYAKSVAEAVGIPDAWPKIYEWKKNDWTDEKIWDAARNGSFDIRPAVEKPQAADEPSMGQDLSQGANSAVKAQMAAKGQPDPGENQGIFAQTMGALGLKRSTMEERVDRRVAQAFGMTPDEFQKAQRQVEYDPDPLPGDPSRSIMYTPKPKLPQLKDIEDVRIAKAQAAMDGDKELYDRLTYVEEVLGAGKFSDRVDEEGFKRRETDYNNSQSWAHEQSVHERNVSDEMNKEDRAAYREQLTHDRDRGEHVADRQEDRGHQVADRQQDRGWHVADRQEDRTHQVLDRNQDRGWKKQDDREQRQHQLEDWDKNRGAQISDMNTEHGWRQADRNQDRQQKLQDDKAAIAREDIKFDRGINTYKDAVAAQRRAIRDGDEPMAKYYGELAQDMAMAEQSQAGWNAKSLGVIPPNSGTVKSTGEVVHKSGTDDAYYDKNGKRYGLDDVVPHTPKMMEDVANIRKEIKEPVQNYVEKAQTLRNAIRLGKEANDIVQSDPAVLTFAGDVSRWVSQIRRDVSETIDLAKSSDNESTIFRNAGQKVAEEEKRLESLVSKGFLNRTDELAVKTSLLEAKATRMAYAQAASVGQVGKGVAVQEFEKIYKQVVNRNGGARGFQQSMGEWLAGEEENLRTIETGLLQQNGLLDDFYNQWGIKAPMAAAPALDDILGDQKMALESFKNKVPAKDELVNPNKDALPMPKAFPDGEAVWNELPIEQQQYFLKRVQK